MCRISCSINSIIYADNTLIYFGGNEIEDLFERINADLLKLNEWFNPLLHAIRNNGITFFSFWNSKENVSNKVIPKKKIFDLLRIKFFFVVHNCVQCAITVLFVQNIKNLKIQKINVSYVYYHIQMTTNVT